VAIAVPKRDCMEILSDHKMKIYYEDASFVACDASKRVSRDTFALWSDVDSHILLCIPLVPSVTSCNSANAMIV
jgi:hypothetical protein